MLDPRALSFIEKLPSSSELFSVAFSLNLKSLPHFGKANMPDKQSISDDECACLLIYLAMMVNATR